MSNFKAEQSLIDRLRLAARHEQSAQEILRQKVSFALGNIHNVGPQTQARAESILSVKTAA